MTPTDTARKPSPGPRGETEPDDGPEDEATEAPEPEAAGDHAQPADRPRTAWGRRRRIITAVLAVLAVAAAAGTWYLANQPGPADVRPAVAEDGSYTPGSVPSAAGAAAVRAATEKVPEALSYDYRTLDKNLRRATEGMTPKFTDTFTDTFNRVVKPMATENKAVTQALVRGAGLADLSDDETTATCVLFVDQLLVTSEGSGDAKPHVGKERVLVTVTDVDGRWLVDNIEPF